MQAALELLAERGCEGMSLQLVADRVGLHNGTPFHHFKSKHDLAQAVYRGLAALASRRARRGAARGARRQRGTLRRGAEAARLLLRPMVTSPHVAGGASPCSSPPGETDSIDRVPWLVGDWLARARAAGAIRPAPARHTVLNLMGLVLLFPGVLHHIPGKLLPDETSSAVLAARKRELRAFLHGALAPRPRRTRASEPGVRFGGSSAPARRRGHTAALAAPKGSGVASRFARSS